MGREVLRSGRDGDDLYRAGNGEAGLWKVGEGWVICVSKEKVSSLLWAQ